MPESGGSALVRTGPLRLVAWLASLVGAISCLALASRSGAPELVGAIGWALLAALGVSLLLQVWGRRIIAAIELLLVAGLVAAWWTGSAHAWLLGIAAPAALGAVVQLLTSHCWPTRTSRYERGAAPSGTTDLDLWKAMDAGLDPTADPDR